MLTRNYLLKILVDPLFIVIQLSLLSFNLLLRQLLVSSGPRNFALLRLDEPLMWDLCVNLPVELLVYLFAAAAKPSLLVSSSSNTRRRMAADILVALFASPLVSSSGVGASVRLGTVYANANSCKTTVTEAALYVWS